MIGPEVVTRDAVAAQIETLKRSSGKSYRSLARELGLSFSTVCDWVKLTHFPFPRQREHFLALLGAMGAEDPEDVYRKVELLRDEVRERPRNPYRGLRPFTEEEAHLFFGRETLVEELVFRTLQGLQAGRGHPIVVIGASGSGKSSILRAGLHAELARAEPELLLDYFTLSETGVEETIARLDAFSGPGVVIVDQFEEWFGGSARSERDRLMEAITESAGSEDVQVVIGIRSDYFARAAEDGFLLAGLQDSPVVVGPMTTDEIARAILRPASRVSLTVDPELVAQLLSEFAETPESGSVSLPLLSHVLYVLVDSSDRRTVGLEQYRDLGGMRAALEQTAEAAFAASGSDEVACHQLFTQLVELGPDGQATRRLCRVEELHRTPAGSDLEGLIAEFAAGRLLTLDHDTVTISHEALLRDWPRLRNWVEEEGERLEALMRLQTAAAAWVRTGEDPAVLPRGSLLTAAEELESMIHIRARLSDDDLRFIAAGRDEARRQIRAMAEARSRDIAMRSDLLAGTDPNTSAQLAILACEVAPTVEARSALVGATAVPPGARYLGGAGPTALAAASNAGTVAYSNPVDGEVRVIRPPPGDLDRRLGPFPFTVRSLWLSPDGGILAVGGDNGGVEIWDTVRVGRLGGIDPASMSGIASSGSAGEGPPVDVGPVEGFAFAPRSGLLWTAVRHLGCTARYLGQDGQLSAPVQVMAAGPVLDLAVHEGVGLVATVGSDGLVSLWGIGGPACALWQYRGEGSGPAAAVDLSPDGRFLAVGFHDGRVRVWNLGGGSVETPPVEIAVEDSRFGSWVNSVDFNPTGELLAAASSDGKVRIWGTGDWAPRCPDRTHPTVVTEVRFRDRWSIATAAEDGTMRLWDVTDAGTSLSEESAWSLGISDDGRVLLTTARSEARLTRWTTGPSGTVESTGSSLVPAAGEEFSGAGALSPRGEWCALGNRVGEVCLERIDGGRCGQDREREVLGDLGGLVEGIAFSPDGSLVAAVARNGQVALWRVGPEGSVSDLGGFGVQPPGLTLAFDTTGSLLAVTSESGHTTLADTSGREGPDVLSTFRTGDSFALGVAFRPGSPILAVGNADRTVSLWDCTDPTRPRLRHRLTGPRGNTITVAFSPDGTRLGAGSTDGTLWIWDLPPGRDPELGARIRSRELGVYAIAFWPDGERISGVGPRHRCFTWTLAEDRASKLLRAAVGDPLSEIEREALGLDIEGPSLP